MRVSEIKRLQSFPDDWILSGKVTDQWRQIGNAVPPLLAERWARPWQGPCIGWPKLPQWPKVRL